MRKQIAFLLCLCLLLPLCGCNTNQTDTPREPVRFFYPRTTDTIDFTSPDGAITYEDREGAGYTGNFPYLLNLYLRGPVDQTLSNPFPAATSLVELQVYGSYAFVTLSDSFAQLSGMELTIACACLTLTVTTLTKADYVCLRAQTQPLDGKEQLTLHAKDFLFTDDTTTPNTDN